MKLATHGIVMERGRVLLADTAAGLLDRPDMAAMFFGSSGRNGEVNPVLDRLRDGHLTKILLCTRRARRRGSGSARAHHRHRALPIDRDTRAMPIDTAAQMSAVAGDIGLTALVRIPEREYGVAGRLLDGGAHGIIAPRVESADQARLIVEACRFPPHGHRSQLASVPQFGMRPDPGGAVNPALDAMTTVQVVIESPPGVEPPPRIAAVPGVDMVALGTNDLTAELGIPGRLPAPTRCARPCSRWPAPASGTGSSSCWPASATWPSSGRSPIWAPARWCSPAPTPTCFTSAAEARTAAVDAWHADRTLGVHPMTIPLETTPMRAADTKSRPPFTLPPGSCDAHFHVFEPGFPHIARPAYTFPDATSDKYLRLTEFLGIERMVLVQPTYYGDDNSLALEVLRRVGSRPGGGPGARRHHGRQSWTVTTSSAFERSGWTSSPAPTSRPRPLRYIRAWPPDRPARLHLQFYTPGRSSGTCFHSSQTSRTFVIDHMGYMREADGLTAADAERLSNATPGNCWIKLSGPYPRRPRELAPVRHAHLDGVSSAFERIDSAWGSDRPHLPDGQRDTGGLLNLLAESPRDENHRRRFRRVSRPTVLRLI